jgi:hypothetical protein
VIDDNTIDVFWKTKFNVWYISRVDITTQKELFTIEVPVVTDYYTVFLGFDVVDNDYVLGYAKANSYGDADSEAWYMRFNASAIIFETRLFGEMDNQLVGSEGEAGKGGLGTVTYNPNDQSIACYLAHTRMHTDGLRHQASYMAFLDASTGSILENTNGNPIGSSWFISHNLDYRCKTSNDGNFITLFHGDAYPRALGIQKWSSKTGELNSFNYFDITFGAVGVNLTKTFTGDFAERDNNKVGIVFSSSIGRAKKDLKFCLVGNMDSTPSIESETWITEDTENDVAWGAKIIDYSEYFLIGWNSFNAINPVKSSFAFIDEMGQIEGEVFETDSVNLMPSQSFQATPDKKTIIWVSSPGGSNLKVHTLKNPNGQ